MIKYDSETEPQHRLTDMSTDMRGYEILNEVARPLSFLSFFLCLCVSLPVCLCAYMIQKYVHSHNGRATSHTPCQRFVEDTKLSTNKQHSLSMAELRHIHPVRGSVHQQGGLQEVCADL
jgi:hypothetical protein